MTHTPLVNEFMVTLKNKEELNSEEALIVAFERSPVPQLARSMLLAGRERIPVGDCPFVSKFKIGYIYLKDIISYVNCSIIE